MSPSLPQVQNLAPLACAHVHVGFRATLARSIAVNHTSFKLFADAGRGLYARICACGRVCRIPYLSLAGRSASYTGADCDEVKQRDCHKDDKIKWRWTTHCKI